MSVPLDKFPTCLGCGNIKKDMKSAECSECYCNSNHTNNRKEEPKVILRSKWLRVASGKFCSACGSAMWLFGKTPDTAIVQCKHCSK